jgi:DNA-binding response OmpR family regulator
MPNHVLVVDDDVSIANLLKIQLTQAGYQVSIALTGDSALQSFYEICPDLVILDIMLPNLQGDEVCRRIRATPEGAGVPVIMLTGLDSLTSMQNAFATGADDYITKPFRREELLLRVKSHLERVERIRAIPSPRLATMGSIERVSTPDVSASHTTTPFSRETPTVSVVIPALNEAENLPFVLPRIPEWVDEIIIVDGHSTDDTVNVARTLCPDVRVIVETRRGKGAALQAGFAEASGDIIVMIDADGSNNPHEIPAFVGVLLAGADFAKGTRFAQGGGTWDMPWIRRVANLGFVLIVRALFGGTYTDLCYGYNAFWAHALPSLNLDTDGFEVETSMNIHALQTKLKITEVPSFESPRLYGTAKLRAIPDGWRVLKTIGIELWKKLRLPLGKSSILIEQPISKAGALTPEQTTPLEELTTS